MPPKVMERALPTKSAALALVLVGTTVVGSGCGHCDGAVRELVIRSVDGCGLDECVEDAGRYTVAPDVSVRVVGDGPNEDADALLAESGVSEGTLFLLDASGQPVAATVSADAGGHSCRNGVGFGLQPDEPLAPGTYTVVLVLDELAWPLVGSEAVQSHEGKEALVRTVEVVDPG